MVRAVALVREHAAGIDAEQVEDRGREIVRANRIRDRECTRLVAGPEQCAAGDAGPRQREAEHAAPVIATACRINSRRAAELTDGHHQRFIQQAALGKIVDQCGERDVELRAEAILEPVRVAGVRVPHRVVDRVVAALARPIHVHQSHPGLDQPARQQHALTPRMPAKPIPRRGRFLPQIEGFPRFPGSDQVEGVMAQAIPGFGGAALVRLLAMPIELAQQIVPPIESRNAHIRRKAHAFDRIVGGGGVADEPLRFPLLPDEPRGLPGRRHVVIEPHHVRNPHRRKGRQLHARLHHLEHGAEVGPVGGLDLPRGTGAVRIAGEHPVAAHVVVVVVRVHGADDGNLVGNASRSRKEFAELRAGHRGLNRFERAANFDRCVRLRVERFVLRRPTLQPQEDDVLRLAEGVGPEPRGERRCGRGLLIGAQKRRQRQSGKAETTDAKPLAAIRTFKHRKRKIVQGEHERLRGGQAD